MQHLSKEDLQNLDRIPRLNLVNSLSGYKSANLIGSVSADGITNLSIFSSVIHLGSNPALLGFILRPPVVPRHTYDNIKATGCYTINHISEQQIEKAHQTSGKYPADISEFTTCGFDEEYLAEFTAPFVKSSKVKMGMKLVEEIPIESNGCLLIIGEIFHLIIPESIRKPDGSLDLNQADTVVISGINSYHSPTHLKDMEYVSVNSE